MAIEGTHLDPQARSVWVDIFQLDTDVTFTVWGPDGQSEVTKHVDGEFVESMMSSFAELTSQGDRVTVLEEHRLRGEHYGTVHELRIDSRDGTRWLQGRVAFVPSVWEAYEDDRIVEFSPGFVDEMTNPHTEEVHEDVLLEVSITSMALQHTLRPPQATNAALLTRFLNTTEPTMATDEQAAAAEEEPQTQETSTEEQTENATDDLSKELADANARIAELEKLVKRQNDELAEEVEEKSEAERKAASLEKRIKKLEDDKARIRFSQGVDSDEDVEMLVSLHRQNPDLAERTYAAMSRNSAVAQPEIGSVGTADVGTPGIDDIAREAADAGIEAGTGRGPAWLAEHYPSLSADDRQSVMRKLRRS